MVLRLRDSLCSGVLRRRHRRSESETDESGELSDPWLRISCSSSSLAEACSSVALLLSASRGLFSSAALLPSVVLVSSSAADADPLFSSAELLLSSSEGLGSAVALVVAEPEDLRCSVRRFISWGRLPVETKFSCCSLKRRTSVGSELGSEVVAGCLLLRVVREVIVATMLVLQLSSCDYASAAAVECVDYACLLRACHFYSIAAASGGLRQC